MVLVTQEQISTLTATLTTFCPLPKIRRKIIETVVKLNNDDNSSIAIEDAKRSLEILEGIADPESLKGIGYDLDDEERVILPKLISAITTFLQKPAPQPAPEPKPEPKTAPQPAPEPKPEPKTAPQIDLNELRKILPAVNGILTRSVCIQVGNHFGEAIVKDVALIRKFMKTMDMYLSTLIFNNKSQEEIHHAETMMTISYSLIIMASIRDSINMPDVENMVKELFARNNIKKYDMREVISFIVTAVCDVKKEYNL